MSDDSLPYPATAFHINQQCTRHLGVIKDLKDPEGRLRVRIEVPGLLGTGKKNWTPWAEYSGVSVGSNNKGAGDEGDWRPPQHGQVVMVEFVAGDPFAYAYSPGPPVPIRAGKRQGVGPRGGQGGSQKEGGRVRPHAWRFTNPKRGTRSSRIATAARNSVPTSTGPARAGCICRRALVEDDEEKEGEESEARGRGNDAGVKTALTGAGKPSELLKDGTQIIGDFDMNGSGTYSIAKDDEGTIVIVASSAPDKCENYFILDTKNKLTIVGSGPDTQIQLDGNEKKIYFTSAIIQNQQPIDVEPLLKGVRDKLAERAKEYE